MIASGKRATTLVGGLASFLVLAACSDDPYDNVAHDACAPGNTRSPQGACVMSVVTLATDGTSDQWANVPSIPLAMRCSSAPCDAPLPESLQLATTTLNGASTLAMHLHWPNGNTPPQSVSVRYALQIESIDPRGVPEKDVVVIGGGGNGIIKNGVVGTRLKGSAPLVIAGALDDGVQAYIAWSLLPFFYGVRVSVALEVQSDAGWTAIAVSTKTALGCTDAGDRRYDRCGG